MAAVQRKDQYTSLKQQPEIFSDFLTNFDKHPVKKDLVRNINEDAIKRSIKNLLQTNRGDRLFNNTLGSDIRSMLFEPLSPTTERVLEDYVRTTINNYEPRADVLDVTVLSDEDEQSVYITVQFSVINKQEPVTLELILNRIR